ncbi:MAG: TonB-dependent receptor [Cellvibrio sp.]|uniref:TonB-dependent receptor n=1 Tax=Cellvibrio sp. TaxID=1965322 RepID=UPI0031A7BC82
MKKHTFNHMLALAATMAMVSGSQAVYAQGSDDSVEEVTVTGFRASLQNSIATKQESSSVIEALTAEDIGKLPDTSIAESLARLPGLAGERRDGRTSGISVRGFNENYVATTMNGREILGIGDNRGVEYDLYPSEILSGAVIYKTPDASKVHQGLGGIVDLQTIRPLERDRILTINANYELNDLKSANPDFDDTGHRAAFIYSDKFADDTIGLALSFATMESPSQEEQFRGWGYADLDNEGPGEVVALGGHDSFVRSSLMDRDTFSGVLQFAPNDQWTFTLDALYIDFTDSKVFRGVEEGTVWGGGVTNVHSTVEDNLVTSGEWSGFHSVIRNDGEVKDGELTTFGFNAEYLVNDNWALKLDVSSGESSKDLLNIESYSGVGRAGTATQGAPAARSYVLTADGARFGPHSTIATPDYSNPANIRLAGPQAWGGAIAPLVGGQNNAQDGFVNNPYFEEELNAVRLQANGEIEFSIVKGVEFGINYSDRTKSKVNYGAFLIAPGFYAADGVTIANGDIAVPEEYIVGSADLSFLGLGSVLAYDGVGIYKDGLYRTIDATTTEPGRKGDTYEVTEKVTTAYGLAKFETGILTGNVGLQVVSSDQSGTGFDAFTGENTLVTAIPVSESDKYTKLLPSLNMNFQITDDQIIRFAASKTASRARMDAMRPNSVIGFSFDTARRSSSDPEFSAWSASEGNTHLKPIEAIQSDLSYEYYYADDGFVSLTYFYKDLQNWHVSESVVTDFTQWIIPGYHDAGIPELVSTSGLTTRTFEAGGGYVAGNEVQVSFPFHVLSDSLDGFGILASGTFLSGEIDYDGEKQRIPGLSKESYQLTVYFEKAGFEFRVSGRKRDSYLTEERGVSLALTPAVDQGSELWDAQIGYDFSESGIDSLKGLTLTLQAQNLTNEKTVTTQETDSRQVNRYQNFGANYLLGASYKF